MLSLKKKTNKMKNYWLKYKKRATQADCTFLMLDKVFLLHLLKSDAY